MVYIMYVVDCIMKGTLTSLEKLLNCLKCMTLYNHSALNKLIIDLTIISESKSQRPEEVPYHLVVIYDL